MGPVAAFSVTWEMRAIFNPSSTNTRRLASARFFFGQFSVAKALSDTAHIGIRVADDDRPNDGAENNDHFKRLP